MTIYNGFSPLKMVIFHSYVSLPEGSFLLMFLLRSVPTFGQVWPLIHMKNVKSSFTKTALATQSRPPFVVGILPDLLTVMADLGSPWRQSKRGGWWTGGLWGP